MSPARPYAVRRPRQASARTRERIVSTVRDLLEEGVFHETTVEEVARRAGVARATLYQHFGSRVGLVDAMCETFARNPALQAAKAAEDLGEFVSHAVDFWATEEKVLRELYAVVGVDPAARDLADRQRRDRYAVIERLVRQLKSAGRLRSGVSERRAFATLAMLTSFETYLELRQDVGLARRVVVETLQDAARRLLVR